MYSVTVLEIIFRNFSEQSAPYKTWSKYSTANLVEDPGKIL